LRWHHHVPRDERGVRGPVVLSYEAQAQVDALARQDLAGAQGRRAPDLTSKCHAERLLPDWLSGRLERVRGAAAAADGRPGKDAEILALRIRTPYWNVNSAGGGCTKPR
jgi:hypothetical protein